MTYLALALARGFAARVFRRDHFRSCASTSSFGTVTNARISSAVRSMESGGGLRFMPCPVSFRAVNEGARAQHVSARSAPVRAL
jgi:hypothetical protein